MISERYCEKHGVNLVQNDRCMLCERGTEALTTDLRLGIALREALDGPKGALDAFLEVHNEAEVKSAIQNMAWGERRQFAAMAMQGLAATWDGHNYGLAQRCVELADALLVALAKDAT